MQNNYIFYLFFADRLVEKKLQNNKHITPAHIMNFIIMP